MKKNNWHLKSANKVIIEIGTNEHGLSKKEASSRLEKFGPNKLPESKPDTLFQIFFRQFQSPLIYILILAAIIVMLLQEFSEGMIIIFVLVFNSIVGTIQEGKAQNTLLALKKFSETSATVLRDGKEIIIPDTQVVPGDIILIHEGEKIPADCRVYTSQNLKIDESMLTGESEPVFKVTEEIKNENGSNQYRNMLYKGTNAVAGKGRAVVVNTGQETVIGSIATKIATIDTEIPLKKEIKKLSHLIIYAVIIFSVPIFILGVVEGKTVMEMFLTIVALSVSVVPEGLPIVVTLVLAMGVWRMGKRNALVKKLQAVEALGQAKIIAVDKTGTITKNEMIVQKVYVDGKIFEIKGNGYEPKGEIIHKGKVVNAVNHPEILFAGKISSISSGAEIMYDAENEKWKISGDPTEAAMSVFSQKLGFSKEDLVNEMQIIDEMPFDYKLKYHAILTKDNNKNLLMVVGAPEVIIGMSKTLWSDRRRKEMTTDNKNEIESIFNNMSEEGLRVIAFAIDPNDGTKIKEEKMKNLSFVGFCGMKDGTKPEAKESIKKAERAGVKFVMITGDHKITARAVAREAGIWKEGDEIITGEEINKMKDEELLERTKNASVFARVNPEHKMKIINAYRANGDIIAMTGDGVNDAPSLVAADLGVAMGKIGTEVAKEASDIVLLDDNLESIVSAIEEGRNIYKTIKKVTLYLFSTNAGEVMTIVGSLIMNIPLPLIPSHIIWLNFVTDGFLDISLAMEPKEKGLLDRRAEKKDKQLFDSSMAFRMLLMATVMSIGTLYLFRNNFLYDIVRAQTITLTVLAVFQWFNAWNCRSDNKSIFEMNPFSNKFLIGATFLVVSLQLLATYNPVMQKFLKTVPLTTSDWFLIILIALSIIVVEELRKFFIRRSIKQ